MVHLGDACSPGGWHTRVTPSGCNPSRQTGTTEDRRPPRQDPVVTAGVVASSSDIAGLAFGRSSPDRPPARARADRRIVRASLAVGGNTRRRRAPARRSGGEEARALPV